MRHRRSTQAIHGFSIIELMIAMTLGLFLTSVVLKIVLDSKDSYVLQKSLGETQEIGRFALDVIARDIRNADFWGCPKTLSNIVNNLNPANTPSSNTEFKSGVSGEDGATNLPDTLTLSGAYRESYDVLSPYMGKTSSDINILSNNNLDYGGIVLISDCIQGDIFQISNLDVKSSGEIKHEVIDEQLPQNYNINPCSSSASTHCLSNAYKEGAKIYVIRTLIYSITNDNNGTPSLSVSLNGSTPELLVSNVENIQFKYGEDTDEDGIINIYRDATDVVNWQDIYSVQISIVTRSTEELNTPAVNYVFNGEVISPQDRKHRRVFSTVVALRNRLSR